MDDTSSDENPYRELIVNNASKIENTLSQMEQWLILSNVINYVQYSKNSKTFHTMSVRSMNKNKINIGRNQGEKDRPTSEISLVDMLDRLTEEYLDRYRGVKSGILVTTRFDENSDLSMTYLSKTNMIRDCKMAAERNSQCQNKGIQQVIYYMILNVRYYWILELANHLCLNHAIYTVNHFILYPNLLKTSKNPSRQWTIYKHTFCHSNNNRYPW